MEIVWRRASTSITGLAAKAGNPFCLRCWLINVKIWSSRAGATLAVEGFGTDGLVVVVDLDVFAEEEPGLLPEQEEKAIINAMIQL